MRRVRAALVVAFLVALSSVAGVAADDWSRSETSWYGPGLYGNRTGCGLTLTTRLQGVAHRSLPCGTLVSFRWQGAVVTVPVVDRGPYIPGRTWDLTGVTCTALDHCWTGPIEWRLAEQQPRTTPPATNTMDEPPDLLVGPR